MRGKFEKAIIKVMSDLGGSLYLCWTGETGDNAFHVNISYYYNETFNCDDIERGGGDLEVCCKEALDYIESELTGILEEVETENVRVSSIIKLINNKDKT